MVEIYALLGGHNVRKSSTVRALSGVYNRGLWQIATHDHHDKFFVETRALQEAETSAAAFIAEVTELAPERVLVPLRVDAFRRHPRGAEYLSEFQRAGWQIAGIGLLGPTGAPWAGGLLGFPAPLFFPGSRTTPANAIAAQFRAAWNWQ